MSNRTIIITGASDGIGAASARQLTAAGEKVVIVGRSKAKTEAIAGELKADSYIADFSELAQVRDLADKLLKAYPRIDVLANNAGGIMGDREVTTDGFEKTFQVNHLAPFLLTNLLLPTLISSSATVIQTSSVAARSFSKLDLDDLGNEKNYTPTRAYGDAKLENILFTKELHRRYHHQGISTVAFHPGNVATSFASDTTSGMRFIYNTPLKHLLLISADEGGRALTWLAEGTPGTTWTSGEYYEKKKIAKTNDLAHDPALATKLWDTSAQFVTS
ncbi:SDR family NAD(P)-dependent oxidoreductase [Modestobacter excelsi]|uniref:SDR family NAD(P)-dependent oxidoreductase n=1 Tax=Modestobacter excelsi TaxID=2213161 RepID=UPI00110CDDD8|nr:SDR family NAD(P)-dependent oxidoreductase [Modestobacter excelsi]